VFPRGYSCPTSGIILALVFREPFRCESLIYYRCLQNVYASTAWLGKRKIRFCTLMSLYRESVDDSVYLKLELIQSVSICHLVMCSFLSMIGLLQFQSFVDRMIPNTHVAAFIHHKLFHYAYIYS
jgi:hypothetical protein